MAVQPQRGLTHEDLMAYPDDGMRRELIAGELIVTPAPSTAHQDVVSWLMGRLFLYRESWGGRPYTTPTSVYLSEGDVLQPDVLFVTEENLHRVEKTLVRGAPDLVIEVSSPSTRRVELAERRACYERFAVPEYWYVDLDAAQIHVDTLVEGSFSSATYASGETIRSTALHSFRVSVSELMDYALWKN